MKIGIDLGGTKTEGILIDNDGKELTRHRIKTQKNYEGTIDGIKLIVNNFENKFGVVESVGIGMPGAVSADSSLVKNANSIWLNGKPLKKNLEEELGRKVNLENDAKCFALSEAVDGAGKGKAVVFGVIIGTGVGGGIVVNQKILQGRNNIGGEWGHVTPGVFAGADFGAGVLCAGRGADAGENQHRVFGVKLGFGVVVGFSV